MIERQYTILPEWVNTDEFVEQARDRSMFNLDIPVLDFGSYNPMQMSDAEIQNELQDSNVPNIDKVVLQTEKIRRESAANANKDRILNWSIFAVTVVTLLVTILS